MATTLTPEQLRKLERIANRTTAYEAVVVHPDGRRVLLCYSQRRSWAGLWGALDQRAAAVKAFLSAPDGTTATRGKGRDEIEIGGGGVVRWSGRTQRDAIMAGELPYVGRLAGGEG